MKTQPNEAAELTNEQMAYIRAHTRASCLSVARAIKVNSKKVKEYRDQLNKPDQ